MALLLSRNDVAALLTIDDAIRVVEEAFRLLALGHVIMPQRTVIRMLEHRGVHLGMPAYVGGTIGALALKVVTTYPDNPSQRQLPTTNGLVLLTDPGSGGPLAVMEAGLLTAIRTGAATGVATRHLARRGANTVGVIGAGVMARWQLAAVCRVRAIGTAVVYDTDHARATSFASETSRRLGLPVSPVRQARQAVDGQDVVIVATSASEPVLEGRWLEPGQHVNAIGSHAPGARELDTEAIVRSRLFVDFAEACLVEAGDILVPMKEGVISRDHLRGDLGEVVAGIRPGRERDDQITVFKSVGLAIQDVATASFVYGQARARKIGVEFEFL